MESVSIRSIPAHRVRHLVAGVAATAGLGLVLALPWSARFDLPVFEWPMGEFFIASTVLVLAAAVVGHNGVGLTVALLALAASASQLLGDAGGELRGSGAGATSALVAIAAFAWRGDGARWKWPQDDWANWPRFVALVAALVGAAATVAGWTLWSEFGEGRATDTRTSYAYIAAMGVTVVGSVLSNRKVSVAGGLAAALSCVAWIAGVTLVDPWDDFDEIWLWLDRPYALALTAAGVVVAAGLWQERGPGTPATPTADEVRANSDNPEPGWYYTSEHSPTEDYWDGNEWANTPRPRPKSELPPSPGDSPHTRTLPNGREAGVEKPNRKTPYTAFAVIVLAAGAWFVFRPTETPAIIDPIVPDSEAEVLADQFCALGQGEGSSLIEIGSWLRAAQRTTDDWDAVVRQISRQCPGWQQIVVDKAGELGN